MPRNHKKIKLDSFGTCASMMSNPLPATVDSSLASYLDSCVTIATDVSNPFLVVDQGDAVLNINCLPPEILIKIFGYLTHFELVQISHVCKKWMDCSNYPALWKEIHVKFDWNFGDQTWIAEGIFENFPRCASECFEFKLNFGFGWASRNERLHFKRFCAILKQRCPKLQTLIVQNADLAVTLGSTIDLCAAFFPKLKKLEFSLCTFNDFAYDFVLGYGGISKLNVLSLYRCIVGKARAPYAEMPSLTKLFFSEMEELSFTFWFCRNISYVKQLEVLNLQDTLISVEILRAVKETALKLIKLCMFRAQFPDQRDIFLNFNLPCLKEICLMDCKHVTGADIFSLIQSCSSLQKIYVHEELSQSFAKDPSVVLAQTLREDPSSVTGRCVLDIVKTIDKCPHYKDMDYLYE